MPSDTPLVEIADATFGYAAKAVVRVEGLALHPGRCLGVFGPNGAGKTTAVRGIMGLLSPLAGEVRKAAGLRIAYMPQQRSMDLDWPMSGMDAALMASSAHRRFGWAGRARAAVHSNLRRLGVDDLAERPFSRLSGGQQQRILLAGAMASDPQLLVLDEPTDGLDLASTRRLFNVLREFTAAGLCTAVISHEIDDLLQLADTVAWLHPAAVEGEPSRVELTTPAALAAALTSVGGR